MVEYLVVAPHSVLEANAIDKSLPIVSCESIGSIANTLVLVVDWKGSSKLG